MLFADTARLNADSTEAFGIEYTDESLKIYSTSAVKYTHDEWRLMLGANGGITLLGPKSAELIDDLDFY